MHQYFVYILTNPTHSVLYIGFTNDLRRRVYEHREKIVPGFTADYNCWKLVYYEYGEDYEGVLGREKQLKGWRRSKKEELIARLNPEWKDLYEEIE